MIPGRGDLAVLVTALEHARPNVKGAALEREVSAALEMGRRMLAEPHPDVEWVLIEDDDGVNLVGQPWRVGDEAAEADAILAEMRENSDLASEEGTARAWILTVFADGRRPEARCYSGLYMGEMRAAVAAGQEWDEYTHGRDEPVPEEVQP